MGCSHRQQVPCSWPFLASAQRRDTTWRNTGQPPRPGAPRLRVGVCARPMPGIKLQTFQHSIQIPNFRYQI